MIGAFLLDENSPDKSLQAISLKYIPNAPDWKAEFLPILNTLKELEYIPSPLWGDIIKYNKRDIYYTWELWKVIQPLLAAQELESLFRLEMENLKTLARMTTWGIKVDLGLLTKWEETYVARHRTIQGDLQVNLNSPQQLLKAFREAGFDLGGTGEDVIVSLPSRAAGGLRERVLEHRAVGKLLSTYLHGLRQHVYPDERIHPRFHQNRVVSGRLSSSDPNGQNFPRDSSDLNYRELFQGTWGRILRLDFNQLELRMAAWIGRDQRMLDVYRADQDLHDNTGERLWRKRPRDISENERVVSKQTNFTALYDPFDSAIGSVRFKCGQNGVDLSWRDTTNIIGSFREAYGGWFDYFLRCVRQVYNTGQVRSPFGRIRRSPVTLQSLGLEREPRSLSDLRAQAKGNKLLQETIRSIINSIVQGSAGDLVKFVGTVIDRRLRKRAFRSRLCNNIHDELLVDVYPPEEEEVIQIAHESAVNPPLSLYRIELDVPLKVDMGIGETWSQAKKKQNAILMNGR